MKPEDAAFKYSNLGGYHEDYDAKVSTQKYQVPIQINAVSGAIEATMGVNYKQVTEEEFTEGNTGKANADFKYTTKGAAKLVASLHNGKELHLEVPLRHISRLGKCKQMFPAGKRYYITLHKAKESFLLCSQDSTAHQNVIFQLTDCTIDVSIIELQPEKQELEHRKIALDEEICYSLMNSYVRSYYIYPIDTTNFNHNVKNGYKPKYLLIYWVDHTHESDGDININNLSWKDRVYEASIYGQTTISSRVMNQKKEKQPSIETKCIKTL